MRWGMLLSGDGGERNKSKSERQNVVLIGGQNVRHLPEKSKAKCACDFAYADTVNFKIAFCNLEIRTKTFRSGLRQNAADHRATSTSPPKFQSDLHFAILILTPSAFCTPRLYP